jgi:hypothetical protein
MNKAAFILMYHNKPVAIIQTDADIEPQHLSKRLKQPILEEVMGDEDGQFEIEMGAIGHWGETTDIKSVKYIQDDSLITDTEFSLIKSVIY